MPSAIGRCACTVSAERCRNGRSRRESRRTAREAEKEGESVCSATVTMVNAERERERKEEATMHWFIYHESTCIFFEPHLCLISVALRQSLSTSHL